MALSVFVKRLRPDWRVLTVDGARTLGSKLLVTGGGRCNLTHREVSETDFEGGSRAIVRKVLRAHGVAATTAFFHDIGVDLEEEPGGKLFPRSGRARAVLDALVREMGRRGVETIPGQRVIEIRRLDHGFDLHTPAGAIRARRVALATGGQALPSSGSDGSGFRLAQGLGHTIVTPTPALVPLCLAGHEHERLAGVSVGVELTVLCDGQRARRVAGSLLFTHRGVSGPAVLDVSRHFLRAEVDGRRPRLRACFLPGGDFSSAERRLLALAAAHPRSSLTGALSQLVPAALARVLVETVGLDGARRMAQLGREDRRLLVASLVDWAVPVSGSCGYGQAEVTAGGVSLAEVDGGTLQSRLCPGLFFAGEVLDVDGRLGGFNLQWAWSSAWVAARGVAGAAAGLP